MPTSKSSSRSVLKNKKRIGITLGSPTGIGPEVIAKSLKNKSIRNSAEFVIFGDKKSFKKYFPKHIKDCHFVTVDQNKKCSSGCLAYNALQKAIEAIKNREIDGLVTGPVNKKEICRFKKNFKGHTEVLADAFKVKHVGMLFVTKSLKTIITTRHLPLKNVSKHITKDLILKTIQLTHTALKKNFKIKNPVLGICGLNPHAGEQGIMGKEEINKIIPAIKKAKRMKMKCQGPFAADSLFTEKNVAQYDAIVAMYHDQGLIPVKTLYFDKVVNCTIGLPFIRTSPSHGTANDIAGKSIADPSSMSEAIKLAVQLS